MREIYVADAIREALTEAMTEDPTVLVLGEDVERSTIGTTKGLIEKFGPTRVRNTPISENGVLSACVGAAASGVRPVFDIMFSSFFYVCLDAIANQAPRLRYMSGFRGSAPLGQPARNVDGTAWHQDCLPQLRSRFQGPAHREHP